MSLFRLMLDFFRRSIFTILDRRLPKYPFEKAIFNRDTAL